MTSMTRGSVALLSLSCASSRRRWRPPIYPPAMGMAEPPGCERPSAVSTIRRDSPTSKRRRRSSMSRFWGHIQAVPSNQWKGTTMGSVVGESEPVVAPAFLVGGAYRITDTAGFGLYPLASAGGGYKYNNLVPHPVLVEDSTKLVLIELRPSWPSTRLET